MPLTRTAVAEVRAILEEVDRYLATQNPLEPAAGILASNTFLLAPDNRASWGDLRDRITVARRLLAPPERRAPPPRR